MRHQRLELRSEQQHAVVAAPVQRLDADPIAHQEKLLPARVPQTDGEHPFQPVDEIGPLLLVQMDQGLAVGARPVDVSLLLQLLAELGVVVDLPVESDPYGAILVRHRLPAGR